MPDRDNCYDCGQFVRGFPSEDPPEDDPYTFAEVVNRPPTPAPNYRVECESCGSQGPTANTPEGANEKWLQQRTRRP